MSAGMSSDQIIKYEIKDKVNRYKGIKLRIFPDSSNEDQKLVKDGGLTFSYAGIDYGSCDAGWFEEKAVNGKTIDVPLIGLEGTDALNRGSSGDAQYQRFHHALGAVKNGCIGIYYLREGDNKMQLDLYEMAYNATKYAEGNGAYLIIQNLEVVNDILDLVSRYGRDSQQVKEYLNDYSVKMHDIWYKNKFSIYNYSWSKFANKRSTIIFDDYIVKYTGRMRRNFTESSQRAGHIAVGEMYLSKYLYYGKKLYYLCPRMSADDVEYLDTHKSNDKEWTILRHEENVFYVTRDNIEGLPKDINSKLESISEVPLSNGTPARRIYDECIKFIVDGLKNGTLKIKECVRTT